MNFPLDACYGAHPEQYLPLKEGPAKRGKIIEAGSRRSCPGENLSDRDNLIHRTAVCACLFFSKGA
jgi:hypothetical protein